MFVYSSQVLELSSAGPKPISSTSHAPKPGMSGAAVFKPSGIGLHLNSLVKALPVSGVETLESIENAVNPQTSSKAVDGLLVRTRIICASAIYGNFRNLCIILCFCRSQASIVLLHVIKGNVLN